jgi:hypothetical protein
MIEQWFLQGNAHPEMIGLCRGAAGDRGRQVAVIGIDDRLWATEQQEQADDGGAKAGPWPDNE